jgi:hypothetical protein
LHALSGKYIYWEGMVRGDKSDYLDAIVSSSGDFGDEGWILVNEYSFNDKFKK